MPLVNFSRGNKIPPLLFPISVFRSLNPRSWMRGFVHSGKVLEIEVRVDLRRADAGVAEEFLHCPQIAGGLQKMGGKAVVEHVRIDVYAQAAFLRPAREAPWIAPALMRWPLRVMKNARSPNAGNCGRACREPSPCLPQNPPNSSGWRWRCRCCCRY